MLPIDDDMVQLFVKFNSEKIALHDKRFVDAGKMNISVYAALDESIGELIVQFYGHVYASEEVARDVVSELVLEVPDTWWDAFKLHFAGRWWMRWYYKHYPAKLRKVRDTKRTTLTVRAFLPGIPLHGRQIRYAWGGGEPSYSRCKRCGAIRPLDAEGLVE